MKTRLNNLIGLSLLLIANQSVYANEFVEQLSPQSQELLNNLISDVRETMSLIAIAEGKQGHTLEHFEYRLDLPRSYKINLGLILEINDTQSAFTVLSVISASLASTHGISVNDQILSVDGIPVSAKTEVGILEKLQRLKVDETLTLTVHREGANREIVIPVSGQYVPQIKFEIGNKVEKQTLPTPVVVPDVTACGEVSVLLTPPLNGQLYPVSFSMNDENESVVNQPSVKLAVGKHIINVFEQIEGNQVADQVTDRQAARVIQINVKANTSYHLGAKILAESNSETPNEVNWEAVIWKTNKQECRL